MDIVGQIEIQGDRISGKILTADISNIKDQDGLPSGFNDFIDGTLDSDCIAKAQSVASSGKFLMISVTTVISSGSFTIEKSLKSIS